MNNTKKQIKRAHNALKHLRNDTRHMIPMEMYEGMGNFLSKTYQALHQLVRSVADDPFLDAIAIDLPPDATDRQVVIQVSILTGQLLSYVEDLYEELEVTGEILEENNVTEEESSRRRFNNIMGDINS